MVIHKYDKKHKILKTKTDGLLGIEDILEHYKIIEVNTTYPRNLKILIDNRNAQFKVELSDLTKISQAVKKLMIKYSSIVESIIVEGPYQTASGILFENISLGIQSYQFKIFSTKKEAKKWLISI